VKQQRNGPRHCKVSSPKSTLQFRKV